MSKQIELFSHYDPEIQEILEGSRVENGMTYKMRQEGIIKPQLYQKELYNINNPIDAMFISDLFYHCTKIDGKLGKDPRINYLYFKRHGTKEEFEKAEKELKLFSDMGGKIAKELETRLENSPKEIKKIRQNFYFLGVEHYLEIERN